MILSTRNRTTNNIFSRTKKESITNETKIFLNTNKNAYNKIDPV